MSADNNYTIKSCPKEREIMIDLINLSRLKHHVMGNFEVDITKSIISLNEYKNKNNESLSFTAWVVKCISQAVLEHKQIHAFKKNNRFIIFDDIDILITIEKKIDNEYVSLPYVIRKSNMKSVREIHDEIRKVQTEVTKRNEIMIGKAPFILKIYLKVPKFFRKFIGKLILKNPYFIKNNTGTISVSSVGMKGKLNGWILPISPQPLCFTIGSIIQKPGVIDNRIEIRDFLNISILFDHDVIDGSPALRFITKLTELLENGDGLP